ncbi:MAG: isopeptide-forming domain-containing fimbrial protein [Methylophilaceae bacterium]
MHTTNHIQKFAQYALKLVLAILLTGLGVSANAAGTAAGSVISNVATVSYAVGAVGQPTIDSNTVNFLVDNKIDLAVSTLDTAEVGVSAGQVAVVTTFSVTNLSNSIQDYALSSVFTGIANPFSGGADSFDPTSCSIFVESGATAGYQATQDIATFVDELAPDASRTVYLVCNMPSTATSNQVAAVALHAETRAGGSAGLGALLTPTTGVATNAVDIVFADMQAPLAGVAGDNLRDAAASAASAYKVGLSVVLNKSIVCTPSPACLSAFKPNDVVTYRIEAQVTGIGTVNNLIVSDPIPADLTYVANSTQVNNIARTDAVDADNVSFATSTVTVNFANVNAPQNFVIEFKAVVN